MGLQADIIRENVKEGLKALFGPYDLPPDARMSRPAAYLTTAAVFAFSATPMHFGLPPLFLPMPPEIGEKIQLAFNTVAADFENAFPSLAADFSRAAPRARPTHRTPRITARWKP